MMSKAAQLLGLMVLWCGAGLLGSSSAQAQTSPAMAPREATAAVISVPRLVKFSGTVQDSAGNPRSGITGITFALYKDQSGGAALWLETQNVTLDAQGRYTVLLGANSTEGMAPELFSSNEAQWLGVQPEGQAEQRVLLASVPYALKAADAETLGGMPASSFVLAAPLAAGATTSTGQTGTTPTAAGTLAPSPAISGSGTPNTLAEFDSSMTNLVSSSISDTGKAVSTTEPVGIGTASPGALLDVEFTTAAPTNALLSNINYNNSTAVTNAVVSAFDMNFMDNSTAANLSEQTARIAYIREAGATGGVTAFDTALTTTEVVNANAPFPVRSINIEGPNMNTGTTLSNFTGLYIGSPSGAGTVTSKFALVTEPNAGNVGIGTTAPTQALELVGNLKLSAANGAIIFPDSSTQSSAATGTITGVTAGSGLSGGGTSGNVTLSLPTSCLTGQIMKWNGSAWTCSADLTTSGTFNGQPTNFSGDTTNQIVYANQTSAGITNPSSTNLPPAAIFGDATNATGLTVGVVGRSQSAPGAGMIGIATGVGSSNDRSEGVLAAATATTGRQIGIDAQVYSTQDQNTSNDNVIAGRFINYGGGLVIEGDGPFTGTTCTPPPCSTQVFTVDTQGNTRINGSLTAGNTQINGSLNVNGTLSKAGGSFKIDHPLDPANKYLYHSFVESPDMKNIYDGVVRLDAHGQAWVDLPDWFEALNRDFRYQLTAIGGPGPGLYVAREVKNSRFKIAGGRANGKVSWQVTGIRHDAYADAHRIQVEEEKRGEERGRYMHPELFGHPEGDAIGTAANGTAGIESAAAGQH